MNSEEDEDGDGQKKEKLQRVCLTFEKLQQLSIELSGLTHPPMNARSNLLFMLKHKQCIAIGDNLPNVLQKSIAFAKVNHFKMRYGGQLFWTSGL